MKIIIRILKKIYGFLLKRKSFAKLRKFVRNVKANRTKRKHAKIVRETFSGIGNISLEEANIEKVAVTSEVDTYAFGFDMLGQVSGLENMDYEEYFTQLNDVLENEDINVRVAIATPKTKAEHKDAFAYMEEKLKIHALEPGQGILFEAGDFKALFFGFEIKREKEEGEELAINPLVIKQLAYAKQNNVNYVVGYALRERDASVSSTPFERAYLRRLALLGCDYSFGSNIEGIYNGGNYLLSEHNYGRSMISLGGMFGCEDALEENARKTAIAIRVKLINHDNHCIVNHGYIPLYNPNLEKKYKDVVRIDYHNLEHRENPEIMGALSYLEENTNKMRDIKNILTIKDICEILEVEIPEQYAYLTNASVGKVCSRSFEVNSTDVLFFRQPFNDPNDKEPIPVERRLRIVEKAIARGARFVFSYIDLDPSIPHIKIEDAREAHIKVCARLRKMYDVRTIGITGSIGKTSTKDMMYNVLSEKYATYRNLRNSNTQVNIGLHVQDFRGSYEFFIQEIGGGRPGGASRHSRMILPEATVVTNIGLAHIGNYGTQEKLMESKLGIIDGMNKNGTIFLNGDDPFLVNAKPAADTVFYAINNHNADYYAENIVEENGETTFEIVHGDHRVPAKLNVLGEYNVLNAVCCYAIGKKFKLTDEEIVRGIAKFETSGVRQNLVSVAGYNLFVDCFNATPASIESALSVLDAIETDKRKIAVLGDVTGMAELSRDVHVGIGEIVKQHKMDELICYGEESKVVNEIALAAGIKSRSITSPKALNKFLETELNVGDVVLFKGSSKNLLAERIDQVFGTNMSDQGFIDKVNFKTAKLGGITYYLFPTYAVVKGFHRNNENVSIAKSVRGVPVYSIGDGAFADMENAVTIKIPNGIRHIGAGSFINCGMIEHIKLPKSIKYIDESAFENCSSLKKIELNEGLLHIASRAFDKCSFLDEITLPRTVQEMGDGVFAGCDNVTVKVYKDSYGEKYCKEHGVEYKVI